MSRFATTLPESFHYVQGTAPLECWLVSGTIDRAETIGAISFSSWATLLPRGASTAYSVRMGNAREGRAGNMAIGRGTFPMASTLKPAQCARSFVLAAAFFQPGRLIIGVASCDDVNRNGQFDYRR